MIVPSSHRPPRRNWHRAMLVLTIVAAGTPLAAQTQAPPARSGSSDALFVNAELTDVGSGPPGRTAMVEWLHPLSATSSVNAGLVSFSLTDVDWTYGRVGTMRRLSKRTVVHGQVDAGSGREQRDRFVYFAAQGTIEHELVRGRLAVQVQDRYVDIHTTTGNIAKVGLTVLPVKAVAVAAALHSSIGENLGTSMSVRVDAHHRGWAVFTGASTGLSQSALVGLGAASAEAHDLNEIFAGTTIPVKRFRITLTIDSLELGQTEKRSFSMTWLVPF